MRRVVIVQSFLKSFRVPFYQLLRRHLERMDIQLDLLFGQPDRFHCDDADIVRDLSFARRINNRYVYWGHRSMVWEPALASAGSADLVILQQGNRHLLNHLLLCTHRLLGCRVALWGHGRNFQSTQADGVLERVKRAYSRRVGHWFAYTDRSRDVLLGLGVPDGRITTVQNAIDTRTMSRDYDLAEPAEVDRLRRELGIAHGSAVAIWCGRFYRLKSVDFLLECMRSLRDARPDFHMLLVGDGQEASRVREFCRVNSAWAHYLGPRYGAAKALCFRLASCQLMPGAVGLSVLDSFAFLTPLITRRLEAHGPEIAYLQDGVNGLLTGPDCPEYTQAVLRYFEQPVLQRRLAEGCRAAREQYTIENMAWRFAQGVEAALSQGVCRQ